MKKRKEVIQIDLFANSEDNFKITKPIRLIESFAGIGFQRLGIEKAFPNKVESWKIMEWAVPSIIGYDSVHNGKKENNPIIAKQDLVERLYNLGISVDYNNPATKEQIARLSETKLNDIYRAIERTNNLVNIMNVKGEDLELDKCRDYTTIWTYSFPCQDLSLAGDTKGMSVSQSEEGGTRSGLVWEIIRILKECKKLGDMPTCLLMENVVQVHSENNKEEWEKLLKELTDLGYNNFYKDMIGNEYGIPQTRNRTFMFSIYDTTHQVNYSFPEPERLTIFLKDLLEKNVDEKYYLSERLTSCFLADGSSKYPRKERFIDNLCKENQNVSNTITTLNGQRPTDQFIVEGDINNQALRETLEKVKPTETTLLDCYNKSGRTDVANTLTTRTSESNNTFLAEEQEIKRYENYITWKNKQGEFNTECNRASLEDDLCLTIACANTPKVALKQELCNKLVEEDLVKEGDVIYHSYTNNRLSGKRDINSIQNSGDHNSAPVLTTRADCLGVCVEDSRYTQLRIRKLTALECMRIMGAEDYVYYNLRDYGGLSESQIIHIAGDGLIPQIPQKILERCK